MSKGLEALEEIKIGWNWSNPNHSLEDNFEIIEKELKALEIIKKKNVAITMIKQTQNVKEYNVFAYDFLQIKRVDEEKYKLSPQPLNEEEYDLVKEVLL